MSGRLSFSDKSKQQRDGSVDRSGGSTVISNGGSNLSSLSKKLSFRRPHSIASTPVDLDDGGFESWKSKNSCDSLAQLQEIIRRREAQVQASSVSNSLQSCPPPQRPTSLPTRPAANDIWIPPENVPRRSESLSHSSSFSNPPLSSYSNPAAINHSVEYQSIISSFPLYTPPAGPVLSTTRPNRPQTLSNSVTVPAGLSGWSHRPQTVSTPVVQTPGQISRNPRPSHSQTWSQTKRPHSVASPSDTGYRSLPQVSSAELQYRRLSLPTPSQRLPSPSPKPSPTFHGLPFNSGTTAHRPSTKAASQALHLLIQSQRNGFNFLDDKVALLMDILDTQERFAQVNKYIYF